MLNNLKIKLFESMANFKLHYIISDVLNVKGS